MSHNSAISACPSDLELFDFIEGRADAALMNRLDVHLDGCATCHTTVTVLTRTPEASARACQLQAGTLVARYTLSRCLGAGAMGVVYAAYDPELDRHVALKLLRPTEMTQRDAATAHQRIVDEARTMAKVAHPHVAAVYDVGQWRELSYISMELVDGWTLARWLQAERPTTSAIITAFEQVASALAAAHAVGIIHRDIKPTNVLVSRGRRVVLSDFGLARSGRHPRIDHGAPPEPWAAPPGATAGTPAYMAPEQRAGISADEQSDQFSLCLTFYEALTMPAAAGPDLRDSSGTVDATARPRKWLPSVPRRIRRLLARGMALTPTQRYPSMGALLEELPSHGAHRSRTHRLAFAVTAVLGVVVAAGMGIRSHGTVACAQELASNTLNWTETRRIAVRDGLRGTHTVFAEDVWTRVEPRLDTYAMAWSHVATDVCRNHTTRHPSRDAARIDCLARARDAFETLVEQAATADASVAEQVIPATIALPSVTDCSTFDFRSVAASEHPDPQERAARGRALARAEVLERLGRYREASAAVESTLANGRRDGDDYTVGQAASLLAYLHVAAGQDREGTALAHEALAAAERSGDHVATAQAALTLLNTVRDPAQLDEAYRWARFARAALTHTHENSPLHARIDQLEGNLLRRAGRYDESLESYAAAWNTLTATVGEAEPSSVSVLMSWATLERDLGHFADAVDLLTQARTIALDFGGPRHPILAYIDNTRATVALATGDVQQSIAVLEGVERSGAMHLGVDHPLRTTVMGNLAVARMRNGEFAAADRLYADLLTHIRRRSGDHHPDIAETVANLGRSAREQGNLDQARTLLTDALARRRQASSNQGESDRMLRVELAQLNCLLGDPDGPANLAAEVSQLTDQASATLNVAATNALADCLVYVERPAQALDVSNNLPPDILDRAQAYERGNFYYIRALAAAAMAAEPVAQRNIELARASWRQYPPGQQRLASLVAELSFSRHAHSHERNRQHPDYAMTR